MVEEEKLKKVCNDFSLLNEEQQDYILGILNALVFANNMYSQNEKDDLSNNIKRKIAAGNKAI